MITSTTGDGYSAAEVEDRFVRNRSEISAFTGPSAALDKVPTVGVAVGRLAVIKVSGLNYTYRLEAGTDAESTPLVVRPDDYAASTNEKVWKLVAVSVKSLNSEDASALNYFAGKVGVGAAATYWLHVSPQDNTASGTLVAGFFRMYCNPASAHAGSVQALNAQARKQGTQTLAELRGMSAFAINEATGVITTAMAGYFQVQGWTSVTRGYGVYIDDVTGTVTNNWGLYQKQTTSIVASPI